MASSVVRSVSFPPDVFRELKDLAAEQKRPRSQVLVDAVRRYHRLWRLEKEQQVGRRYARKMGIQTEADVDRLIHR